MPSPEPRRGLGARKERRSHPAIPQSPAASQPFAASVRDAGGASPEGLVMLCVRVDPSLRRRLKLVSVSSGRSIQALAGEALEAICKQHDV